MSMWGASPDENDDAIDWLEDFLADPSLVTLNDAFDGVLGVDAEVSEYLEVTECAEAVMAAAVLVDVLDRSRQAVFLDDDSLEQMRLKADRLAPGAMDNMVTRAGKALQIVKVDGQRSELFQMAWADSNRGRTWARHLDVLERRLEDILNAM